MERRVLGKGLGALISPEEIEEHKDLVFLKPENIAPNRYQPRLNFKEDKLQELIDSIREKGVVQPVVVRRSKNNNNEYELIAGERRLRAVKALGHREIPAVVKNVGDQEMLEISIIENIQRDDLNPLEEAKAYETLMKDFGFTQDQVAQTVSKSRATVANMLRLLSLPEKVKDAMFREDITFGHAKAILSVETIDKRLALLEKIVSQGLSVREAEHRAAASASGRKERIKFRQNKDQHVVQLEEEMQHIFGTKVSVFHGKKKGRVQIEYYSLDDLERILNIVRT
ncbi:MAG: ParB/RepB/Spo0J family partition protein [Candidatus Omnitrophica bacterium]|nr:ParB/RepB/Spo0J family partition protein [Candidatus Omnitrophota bacterium]MBU4479691.1 ParB/RepB/Spo0J family partition protein [Candidatus Omnitrophota bacterium]MCG2703114.1 ParB/RepB/Spo0J family partition protein [Candidatus Omnitrophota bacterium]